MGALDVADFVKTALLLSSSVNIGVCIVLYCKARTTISLWIAGVAFFIFAFAAAYACSDMHDGTGALMDLSLVLSGTMAYAVSKWLKMAFEPEGETGD